MVEPEYDCQDLNNYYEFQEKRGKGEAVSTQESESFQEQLSRVRQMVEDDGDTWDLSDNDKAAIRAVLESLGAVSSSPSTPKLKHLQAALTTARLAVNDFYACATNEELERWRAAQNRLIDAAKAIGRIEGEATPSRDVAVDGVSYGGHYTRPAHDAKCEAELTSHGYTPCRCAERAGEATPSAATELTQAQEQFIKSSAENDGLWTTQETVETSLRIFAKVILTLADPVSPSLDQEKRTTERFVNAWGHEVPYKER